jgi:hypothetical protein
MNLCTVLKEWLNTMAVMESQNDPIIEMDLGRHECGVLSPIDHFGWPLSFL